MKMQGWNKLKTSLKDINCGEKIKKFTFTILSVKSLRKVLINKQNFIKIYCFLLLNFHRSKDFQLNQGQITQIQRKQRISKINSQFGFPHREQLMILKLLGYRPLQRDQNSMKIKIERINKL
ncbi:hypothetical protein pb186bvf_009874 [Paramecium bursaria]